MKITVTLEIEVSDLPQHVRKEMTSMFCGTDDGLDAVPQPIAEGEFSEDDAADAVQTFFSEPEYDMQAEAWAGSNQFIWFSDFTVKAIKFGREACHG
jgi:hypothetical protein